MCAETTLLPSDWYERNQTPLSPERTRAVKTPSARAGTPCGRGTTAPRVSLAVAATAVGSEAVEPAAGIALRAALTTATSARGTVDGNDNLTSGDLTKATACVAVRRHHSIEGRRLL